jgi:hypothetical protein
LFALFACLFVLLGCLLAKSNWPMISAGEANFTALQYFPAQQHQLNGCLAEHAASLMAFQTSSQHTLHPITN